MYNRYTLFSIFYSMPKRKLEFRCWKLRQEVNGVWFHVWPDDPKTKEEAERRLSESSEEMYTYMNRSMFRSLPDDPRSKKKGKEAFFQNFIEMYVSWELNEVFRSLDPFFDIKRRFSLIIIDIVAWDLLFFEEQRRVKDEVTWTF